MRRLLSARVIPVPVLSVLITVTVLLPLAATAASASPSSHAATTTTTTPVTQIPTSPYSPCINNDCPSTGTTIVYNGGPLITAPVIYLINFSDSPTSLSPATGFDPSTFASSAPNAAGAALAAVNSSQGWWRTEYSVPGYTIGQATYGGTITLFNPSLADQILVSDSAIQQALSSARADGQLPSSSQDIFVTFLRLGQISYIGNIDTNSSETYCAYHSFNTAETFTYAVIPNDSTSPGCAATLPGDPTPTPTPFDALTSALSHEITETITDPFQSGWYQAVDTPATAYSNGEEVADLCEGPGLSGTATDDSLVPYGGSTYALQYMYSNSAQACLSSPLSPTLLLTEDSSTSVTARLFTADEGLASVPVTLTTPSGTLTYSTNTTGVATFAVQGLSPGATISATSANTGGVAAASASIATYAPGGTTLSVTQTPLTSPTSPISLSISVTPPASGTTDVFGPFGQLLGTAAVSATGSATITLSSSTTGDADTVVYYNTSSSATSTTTITTISTLNVTATGSPILGQPYDLTVTVSPAEAGVSVYTDLDGFSNLTTAAEATNSAGIAYVPIIASYPGPSTVAVYAITPHGVISTDVDLDFRDAVSLTVGTVSQGHISLTIADQDFNPYANSPLTVKIGSAATLSLTTDATGSVSINANPSAGTPISLSWPQNTDYTAGHITFFAPDPGLLTVPSFVRGTALTTAGPNVSGVSCKDTANRVSCKYSNQVDANERIKGLSSLRIFANRIVITGAHPRTIKLSSPKDYIYVTYASTGFLESAPELAIASANGKVLWHS